MKKLTLMLSFGFISLSGNALADVAFTLPSGVKVKIVEAKFQKDHFHLSGCEDVDKPCLINGHVPFGPTEDLPKTYVSAITVSYPKKGPEVVKKPPVGINHSRIKL